MQLLELKKHQIIEDYKNLSLNALMLKYDSTKYLMRSFLVKNGIKIKDNRNLSKEAIKSGVKKCSKCNSILPLSSFGAHKTVVCGLRSSCKRCRSMLEPSRAEYCRKWRKENPGLKARLDKEYRENNVEKIKAYKKSPKYKKIKALSDKRQYEKIKKDPIRLLSARVKSSMSESIRFGKKSSYFKILGYTIEDLKARIEDTFYGEMSWNNYGRNGWHIDHIKPLVLYNLSKEEEFIQAWSLNNLRALWEFENCSKGSFYENKRHFRNGKSGASTKK